MKRDHRTECSGCGAENLWVLHTVHHRARYRRLCTNCVLKNHQGLFCPICLDVFEGSLLPSQRVVCLRCPSVCHLSCAGYNVSPSFYCLNCSNPNFTFFTAGPSSKRAKGNNNAGGDEDNWTIDKDSAKALVAAARISAASMNRAAANARAEAEKRVKEAALARKRASEALELLAFVRARELKEKEKNSKGGQRVKSKIDAAFVENSKWVQRQYGNAVSGAARNGVDVKQNEKQSQNVQGEKENSGLYSVSHVAARHLQHQQSPQ